MRQQSDSYFAAIKPQSGGRILILISGNALSFKDRLEEWASLAILAAIGPQEQEGRRIGRTEQFNQ